MAETSRLSLNQITTPRWTVHQAVEGCARHGIPYIALWRDKLAEASLSASAKAVRDAGLQVSSVCRGGNFPALTAAARRQNLEDNCRAVDEAAALHADSLVMVVGGATEVELTEARRMVEEGLTALVPYAQQCGVRLGLEPLHPMYAAERSVLNTVEQALLLASGYPADQVGVVLDAFHIWWDPKVLPMIHRAAGRICGFHVSDWLVPLPDLLLGRGMMGDGIIDLPALRSATEEAGYHGPIEVEIFNRSIWDMDPDQVLQQIVKRFAFV